MIPVSELFNKWSKDPEFMEEYNKLEPEFKAMESKIDARIKARELAKEKVSKPSDLILSNKTKVG